MGGLRDATIATLALAKGPLCQAELVWRIAELREKVTTSQPDLTDSTYSATNRCILSLVADEVLVSKKVRPLNFAAVVTTYPWQTQQADVKEMRQKLLPQLEDELRGAKPRFNLESAELRLFTDMAAESPARLKAMRKDWIDEAKPLLLAAAAKATNESEADFCITLLVRGVQLFEQSLRRFKLRQLTASSSFIQLATTRRRVKPGRATAAAIKACASLVDSHVKSDDLSYYRFKARLYAAADFRTSTAAGRLHEHALDALYANNKAYFERFSDHVNAIGGSVLRRRKPVYSSSLDQLLQKDCLRSVRMLRLPA